MAEPAIAVKGITKVFDANTAHPVTALDNVSLTIHDNEFYIHYTQR